MLHDTDEDVTDLHRDLTPQQDFAVWLCGYGPGDGTPVRLSIGQWNHVQRVIAKLDGMGVDLGTLPLPTPRRAPDDR